MSKGKTNLNEVLKALATIEKTPASDFDAPQALKKAATKDIKDTKAALDNQRSAHRTTLLILVGVLCGLSFLLLAWIVLFQMYTRLDNPDYVGVSDTVINILTGGVFGELIAVIAIIAKEVWKDPS